MALLPPPGHHVQKNRARQRAAAPGRAAPPAGLVRSPARPRPRQAGLRRRDRGVDQDGQATPEEQAEIGTLEARQGVLAELDDDAWTEELVREAETIEERLDEIEGAIEGRAVYRREDFGIAGCIATIGRDGTLQIIHGLVRPEDMPKEPEAVGEDGAGTGDGKTTGPVCPRHGSTGNIECHHVPFTLNFVLSGMILVAEPIGLAL